MKLLIVDDEELTRTGVISSVDWKALGIDEVLQADDGVHGLETARLHRPEIILCDVRMPRMNGITMLERLEKILPDSVPIFMSGYSDKEYLKAAIRLKAVNYIEKPLNPAEIQEAVREARDLYMQKLHSHRGENLKSMELSSQLALLLTVPYGASNSGSIEALASELKLTVNASTCFTAYIVKMDTSVQAETPSFAEFHENFREFLRQYHMSCVYTEKRMQYLVYFLFGQAEPTAHAVQAAGAYLRGRFEPFVRFSLAAGDTVYGVSRAYQSYASAVILLQSSFFFPVNTMITGGAAEENASPGELPLPAPETAFSESLSSGNEEEAFRILAELEATFSGNRRFLQNPVRDLYYRLFLCLEESRRQQAAGLKSTESIAEMIGGCFTFSELHETLTEKTRAFFKDAADHGQENPTIFLIKKYISQNYMKENLSVKDISAHVFLSTSYVCTFFKNETGSTLNQYITEYRMEKAKQLLMDSRYKISDISSRVGYSDGNYFGKSFKKHTGLSPSEYREKNLQ
mgnify:CR=1 FL=1